MAVSQTLTLTEVAGSVDTAANTSKVRILWQSTQTNDSHNLNTRTAKYYISINGGAETEYTVSYTLPLRSTKTILDTTITVNHKDDGSGTVSVRTWMDTKISAGVVEKSGSLTLTTIARASTIEQASNITLGSNCNVRWTPQSPFFRYKLLFELGNWSYTTEAIYPKKTTAYTYSGYTIPLAVANQITSRNTGNMEVTLYTYSDSGATVKVGSDSSVTFKVTVPENEQTKPIVKTMSVAPVSSLKSPFNSLYIQGHSKVKATLEFETKYKATVAATNITVDGNTYTSPYESDVLNSTGKLSVKASVRDSRGYYGTNYREIDVLPYSKPYVQAKSNESNIVVARCDASANFTDSGTYLKIKAKVVYSKVISNGTQYNYGKIKFRYRKEGGSYPNEWQTIHDCRTTNSDEVITAPLLNGALDVKSNYQVQVMASDELGFDSNPITFSLPSDEVYMDRPAGGKSMALGGYSTGADIFDVYWRTKARGGLSVFDATGNEIPLDSTMPIPRDQLKGSWNANSLANGIYIVTDSAALIVNGNTIMSNGVLIQMSGNVGGSVKFQLALPVDTNRNPMYRIQWYSNWSDWRSLKL